MNQTLQLVPIDIDLIDSLNQKHISLISSYSLTFQGQTVSVLRRRTSAFCDFAFEHTRTLFEVNMTVFWRNKAGSFDTL